MKNFLNPLFMVMLVLLSSVARSASRSSRKGNFRVYETRRLGLIAGR